MPGNDWFLGLDGYGRVKPTTKDVLLLIEVADSSPVGDLQEKADIYATAGVHEYWVVDVNATRIHVMSESNGRSFPDIKLAVAPNPLAPRYLPSAILNLRELFEVV